jgi:hypothetical protein
MTGVIGHCPAIFTGMSHDRPPLVKDLITDRSIRDSDVPLVLSCSREQDVF